MCEAVWLCRRAVRLGTDRALLSRVREGQAAQRQSAPLFDTPLFTRDFERKMIDMFEVCVGSATPGAGLLPGCTPLHLYATRPR